MPERKPESLGFDKPSFVYDHSDDQVEKDTILLNYCIDDIEAMCKVNLLKWLCSVRSSKSACVRSTQSFSSLERHTLPC